MDLLWTRPDERIRLPSAQLPDLRILQDRPARRRLDLGALKPPGETKNLPSALQDPGRMQQEAHHPPTPPPRCGLSQLGRLKAPDRIAAAHMVAAAAMIE